MESLFLSYSQRDRDKVQKLARDLRSAGMSIWYDDWSVLPGDSIIEKMDKGLTEATVILVCVTQHSLASIWARREVQAAIARSLTKGFPVIIPLLFDNSELPPLLAHLRHIPFYINYKSGIKELLNALDKRSSPLSQETSFRYLEYISTTTIDANGDATLYYEHLIQSGASLLNSLPRTFNLTALPKMPQDRIALLHKPSKKYAFRIHSHTKESLIYSTYFTPALKAGSSPLRVNYSYILKRGYPISKKECKWQDTRCGTNQRASTIIFFL